MAVSTAYEPLTFTGNGSTTAFAVTWPFLSGTLVVTEIVTATGVETVKTISTHYTVTGGTDANGLPSTGTVTANTAPAATVQWRIERVTPRTQATVYSNNDAFPAKTHEAALDKLTMIGQEILFETARALKLRTADIEAGVDPVLPLVTDQGGETLAINVGEDGIDLTDPSGLGLGIGTVTTGAAGSAASATITGAAPDLLLNLTIPRGDAGASGAGSGDMLAANNLSDVALVATARTNLGVGTLNSPEFAGVNIGHATDTTLTRVSAGVAAIEGSNILLASGLGSVTQAYSASLAAVAAVTVTAAGTALLDDANAAAQRTTLGLGTAAVLNVGTAANNIVQLTASAKLPAVDGSALTNVPGGKLVSRAYASYTASADLTAVIPLDDTVPQITEGTELLTVAITPSSTSNRIRITVAGFCGLESASGCTLIGGDGTIALFRDATAGALYAKAVSTGEPSGFADLGFVFEHAPSTVSTITYRLRVGGPSASTTMRVNGTTGGAGASARRFGGVAALTLNADEIVP